MIGFGCQGKKLKAESAKEFYDSNPVSDFRIPTSEFNYLSTVACTLSSVLCPLTPDTYTTCLCHTFAPGINGKKKTVDNSPDFAAISRKGINQSGDLFLYVQD
jgi:hypothetical protein